MLYPCDLSNFMYVVILGVHTAPNKVSKTKTTKTKNTAVSKEQRVNGWDHCVWGFQKHLSHSLSFIPDPFHPNQRLTWVCIQLSYVKQKISFLKKNKINFISNRFGWKRHNVFCKIVIQINKGYSLDYSNHPSPFPVSLCTSHLFNSEPFFRVLWS